MKNIIISLFLFLNILSAESYLSLKDNNIQKPILVLVTMNHCKYCEKQKQSINNSVLREYIDKNFQYKEINKSRFALPKDLYTEQTPTIFIMTKDGTEIDKIIGYTKSKELLNRLNKDLFKVYDHDRYKL